MTYEATVLTTAGDVAQFKAGAVVLLQGQSALDVPVNFSVATSKFTVNASTGAAVFAGAVSGITTLGVSDHVTMALTKKLYLDGATSNWIDCIATNNIRIVAGGGLVGSFTPTGLSVIAGSAAAPSLRLGDSTTGFYRGATDEVDIACGGTRVVYVYSGMVGIIGGLTMASLPTSNPGGSGIVWKNGNVLNIT